MRFRVLSIILILLCTIYYVYGDHDWRGNQEPHYMAIEAKRPYAFIGQRAAITAMSAVPMKLQYHNGILNPEDFNFTSFMLVNSGIVILILVVFWNIKRK